MRKSSAAARIITPYGVRLRNSVSSAINASVTPMVTTCSSGMRRSPSRIGVSSPDHRLAAFGRAPYTIRMPF